MAYKRADVRRKRSRPNSTQKRKRKTNKKKIVSKRKRTRKRDSTKREISRKETSKNKRHIQKRKISKRKPVRIKSCKIERKSSQRKLQRRTTSVRNRIVKRKSSRSRSKKKVSVRYSRKRKLVHKKCHQNKHVNRNKGVVCTQSKSRKKKIMNKKFVEKCRKKAIQSVSNVTRRTQVKSFKKQILSTRKFEESRPHRSPKNEKGSFQQSGSNIRPREELFEQNQRNLPVSHFQSNIPSSEQLQSNEQLFKQVKTNDCLFKHLRTSEPLSDVEPVASNIPEWLQTELNQSTSLEPMSPSLTLPRASRNAQIHYYEIQEVYYEHDGELQLLHLNDIGLFDNFEAARDSFIQNYLEKIKNGCQPERKNEVSYQWLYNAIEASRNSIYGYWLRVNDPKSGGFHETFLRKKRWSNLANNR